MKYFFMILMSFCLAAVDGHAAFPKTGKSLIDGKPVRLKEPGFPYFAVVFLSSSCPCSNSHVSEIARLSKKYPRVRFVAVHSNGNEKAQDAKKYFQEKNLGFPVITDPDQKLANHFKALKTPHVFIFNSSEKILYNGGVSNSSNFPSASKNYLAMTLGELAEGKSVSQPRTRSLGCVIQRN